MQTLAQLYHAFSCRFYLVYGGDDAMRRSGLDEEFLEPYKLLAKQIEKIATDLGDRDIIQMLNVYTELDQSYEGFY